MSSAPTPQPTPKKFPLRTVISSTILIVLIGAFLLMFRKPEPVAPQMAPADVAANAQSFDHKIASLAQATSDGNAPEVRITQAELQAVLVQSVGGTIPGNATAGAPAPGDSGNGTSQTQAGGGDSSTSQTPPVAPDQQVSLSSAAPVVTFEGDVVRGQFHAEVAGREVVVTVAGHLGAQNGYVTFDPTEFKVGDVSVPVSLVNSALQKKMEEEKDKMKLPDGIASIKVENGQLVIVKK